MNSKSILLLVFAITILSVTAQDAAQSEIATVLEMAKFCQLNSTCSSGYRLTICGKHGFYYSSCVEKCTLGVSSFAVRQCDKNYRDLDCKEGVCFYYRNIHTCQGYNSCPAEGYINNTACTDCNLCQIGKCMTISDSPDEAGPTQCYLYKNCQFKQQFYQTNACPMDFNQVQPNCSCCITHFRRYDKEAGQCIEDDSELNTINELKVYAKATQSYNTTDAVLDPECQKFTIFVFESIKLLPILFLAVGCLVVQFA